MCLCCWEDFSLQISYLHNDLECVSSWHRFPWVKRVVGGKVLDLSVHACMCVLCRFWRQGMGTYHFWLMPSAPISTVHCLLDLIPFGLTIKDCLWNGNTAISYHFPYCFSPFLCREILQFHKCVHDQAVSIMSMVHCSLFLYVSSLPWYPLFMSYCSYNFFQLQLKLLLLSNGFYCATVFPFWSQGAFQLMECSEFLFILCFLVSSFLSLSCFGLHLSRGLSRLCTKWNNCRNIPTGVLFDLLCAEPERPWNLTVWTWDQTQALHGFLLLPYDDISWPFYCWKK